MDASAGALGEADDRVDAGAAARRLVERGAALAHEERVEQQVLRRVARQGQFGKDDEVRAGLARPAREGDDALEVPAQVPDRGVDLRQRDPLMLSTGSPPFCGVSMPHRPPGLGRPHGDHGRRGFVGARLLDGPDDSPDSGRIVDHDGPADRAGGRRRGHPDHDHVDSGSDPGRPGTTTTTRPRIDAPAPPASAPATVAPPPTLAPTVSTTTPTTTVPQPSPEGLYFSASFILVPALPLDGAELRSASFVFLDLPDVLGVVVGVDFSLDGQPTANELAVPWELFGGRPLVPGEIGPGTHTVRADITFADGRTEARVATFTSILG